MDISLKITSVDINTAGILAAVEGPELWTFAASEWHRLYQEYVPMKTGLLYSTVNISGGGLTGRIEHTAPYAHYAYMGLVMGPNVPIMQGGAAAGWFSPVAPKHYTGAALNFSGKGCAKWDQAALGKKPQLVAAMQAYVDSML